MEGRTKLMALCRWPRAYRWALTGAAAIWAMLEGNSDERSWEHMCPVVSLLVPRSYRTHRASPKPLQLVGSLDECQLHTHPPFYLGPPDEALARCADELGRSAAVSYYPELAEQQLTRWTRAIVEQGLVAGSLTDLVEQRFAAAFKAARSRR